MHDPTSFTSIDNDKNLEAIFLLYQLASVTALESPAGLVEPQTAGPCSQKWVRPKNLDFAEASGPGTTL